MSLRNERECKIDGVFRFIRDDEESKDVSWEERLARTYESKLFKEFALVSISSSFPFNYLLPWVGFFPPRVSSSHSVETASN